MSLLNRSIKHCCNNITKRNYNKLYAIISTSNRTIHTTTYSHQQAVSYEKNQPSTSHVNTNNNNSNEQPYSDVISKSSVRLTVANSSGSLNDALKHFWKHDINMTRIESRPSKTLHGYYDIYVDWDGSVDSQNGKSLLNSLNKHCHNVTILQSKRVAWFVEY